MSFDRGWAAFNLQTPAEIPHTQYVDHPAWVEFLQRQAGRPGASVEELLDFDFVWYTDLPDIPRGRWTDMGHAVYLPDGSDWRLPRPSPFADVEEIYALDPFEEYGRVDINRQAENYQAWYEQARKGDWVIPGGIYNSVVSFAIAAFGWENLLLAAGLDSERFGRTLDRWTDYVLQYVQAWCKTDIAVYHTHDDIVWTAGGFFSPEFYRRYVFLNLKRQWDCAKDAGKKVLFTSDGNYSAYIDDLVAAGADGFIFDPTTDLEDLCRKYGRTHIIIGNADCRVLTFGTRQDVYNEVKRCMDIGRSCPGFFFAVGNHIPCNVPIENAQACMEAYWEMRKR
ncbi:MAG: uroporphyrinogen decarboxylase family protein [Phycisphaerae bacterium]